MQEQEKQFEQLFRTEYDRMYRAAYLLLRDKEEARDAVQDVMERLWQYGRVPQVESLSHFLLVCVRNQCLNRIRQKTVSPIHDLSTMSTLSATATPTHDAELLQLIHRYIDTQLTEQTARVVRMRFDDGLSYNDISRQLGISVAAVNKHIVQGLKKLRQQFKNQCS